MEYRLNRYISNSGYCSRREADRLIEEGQVLIDGKKAKLGMRVFPNQVVKVNGQIIENEIEPVYIAFNKPVGVVSTTDSNERDNIIDYISHEQRIFPIGRLDKDSQGLILLTNNGDIVNKILRAGNKNSKEYIVTVDKPITDTFLNGMSKGVPILGQVTRKALLEKINPNVFKIVLTQGLNRQIRRMCEYFGYNVVKLERIRVMNIHLGKLGMGNYRNLTNQELNTLFDLLQEADKEDKRKQQNKSSNKTSKAAPSKNKSKARSQVGAANSKKFSPKNSSRQSSKKSYSDRGGRGNSSSSSRRGSDRRR